MHSLLATTDLNGAREAIETHAAQHARLVDADHEEIKAAIDVVIMVLAHPIMRRAADAALKGDILRETPVLLRGADGMIAEGVVDLAFREETPEFVGWAVVDFKTDREFDLRRSEYVAQVASYAAAIERATDLPAQGLILVV